MMSAPNRKAEVEKAFAGLTIHPKRRGGIR
jgi:hypothetical protein